MQTIKKSLSTEGWKEEKIKEYDALALEDHSNEATPQERRRWQRNWKIVLNREGVHGSISQRLDFREAKRAYCRLVQRNIGEGTGQGNESIHPAQQRRAKSSTTI